MGVVLGRDFVWREYKWVVSNPEIITDNIDGLQKFTRTNGKDALVFFENRYRIFLTRGMLGTFIFCEDEETERFLNSILEI